MLDRDRILQAIGALAPVPTDAPASDPAGSADGEAIVKILGARAIDTEHGPAFVKETRFPLEHRHGRSPLGALLEAAPEALRIALGGAAALPPARLAFFDTETTGLAGGTGTYIFLAGLGAFVDGAFRLRQYFLASLEGEKAMLDLLRRHLLEFEGVVTYNGRAFDFPLLLTRFTLARMRADLGELAHIDLLRATRRLYRRRLVSCRLAEVESRILGFSRQDDVPGHLIPSLYFDYLRAGRVAPLRGVFRHNALDILSLSGALAFMAGLFSREELEAEDAVAVARWWELEGEPHRALRLYRSALPRLDPARDAGSWTLAARRCAVLLKRAGERADALDLWHRLWTRGDLEAGVEVAKHLEHVARDFAAAAEVARGLVEACSRELRAEVEHRLDRLRKKIQGRKSR